MSCHGNAFRITDPFSLRGANCAVLWCFLCCYSEQVAEQTQIRMMQSSNGNIFRVTGHLCGEFTGPGEFPAQRPVTRSFDVFFDLRQNKRLSKLSWGWWFETLSRPLWRRCNGVVELSVILASMTLKWPHGMVHSDCACAQQMRHDVTM